MSSRQTIINIYIILYNVIDFKEFPMQTYVPFHVVPFLIGFHFTLHHISMSWSLSLQVSLFCKLILLYIPLKAPMFFLQLNSFVHLFHICVETNFINWPTDHGFNNLFILFSLMLVPEAVGWDASNTRQHDELIELPF